MSSLSSTTPARNPGAGQARKSGPPSRSRGFWTWVLLTIWIVLMAFGAVSMTNPEWLEGAKQGGKEAGARAYRHYGDAELEKSNYKLAIAQYLRALEIRSDQPEVLVNLSIAYLKLGDLSRGKNALLRAARMEATPGTRSFIALYLGDVSERENRADEAVGYYREALSLGARPKLVYRKLGALYLRNKDHASARDAFEKSLREQTDPLLPYREMLSRSRERAEKDPEIQRWPQTEGGPELSETDWARYDLQSIHQMHATDPEIAKTHNHLGLISYHMGDLETAIRHFEGSLAIWPGNADAVRNLQVLKSELARAGS